MAEPKSRNWSTKTLARELLKFLQASKLDETSSIAALLRAFQDEIVKEEVGASFEAWSKKRPDPRDPQT